MRATTGAPVLLFAAALAGCGFVREPTRVELEGTELMVASVLVAGSGHATVLVTEVDQAQAASPFTPVADPVAVVGAAVVLTREGGEALTLEEAASWAPPCLVTGGGRSDPNDRAGPGCYAAAVPGGLRPGERWTLEVRTRDGRIVDGHVRIPGPPAVAAPLPGARIPVRSADGVREVPFTVRWTAEAGAAGALVGLDARAAYQDGVAVPDAECPLFGDFNQLSGDSARVHLYDAACFRPRPEGGLGHFVADSVAADVVVAAYDSAYARYLEALDGASIPLSSASPGLTGAFGVLAGLAPVRVPVMLLMPRRGGAQSMSEGRADPGND